MKEMEKFKAFAKKAQVKSKKRNRIGEDFLRDKWQTEIKGEDEKAENTRKCSYCIII